MRLLLCLILMSLSGCGQKGQLYLPVDPPIRDAVQETVDEAVENEDKSEGTAPLPDK